jgi:CubicO group peptidase (beta-lactamase class C family)
MLNTSQQLNKSYGYLWWLNGKSSYLVPQSQFIFNGPMFPNAPSETITAVGKDGQFLNIVPSKNMVWLRMGNSTDASSVPFLLNDRIWEYINKLDCNITNADDAESFNEVRIYPNPSFNIFNFSSKQKTNKVVVSNLSGQLILEQKPYDYNFNLDLSHYPSGIYFIKMTMDNGNLFYKKISLKK